MQRPSPPDVDFDFGRPLNQPEDEFFALPFEDQTDETPQEAEQGPLAGLQRITDRMAVVRRLGSAVRAKLDRRDRDAELDEITDLSEFGPAQHMNVMGSELEEHMVRLSSSHDFQAFLEAEQEATLFESYEREVSTNFKLSNWGLALAVLLFMWLGYKQGVDYLKTLTDIDTPVSELLSGKLPAERARGAQVVAGFLAPAVGFLVLAQAFTDLLGGVVLRSIARGVPGLVGAVGGWVLLTMLGSGLYLQALAAGLVVMVVARFVAAVLRAAEVS